ncbi:sigma factor-like helix-turn-helix DNA-binding protein [Sphingomonas koreensis]|uniref:sigma factor-like helix-turn-helix DNA-binding protein n=1 Tax=Sphingomonas koreensis TaxID=93064 RepID=UPI0013DFFE6C|nr:sigma factor-like helix-turn-helix DNA-binding protein [Sphingomonas koreensis]
MACDIDLDLIRRRFDTLPMATRAVFLLLRLDDLDYGQIAWRLGIGIEEIERYVARAMLVLTWGTDEQRAEAQPRE